MKKVLEFKRPVAVLALFTLIGIIIPIIFSIESSIFLVAFSVCLIAALLFNFSFRKNASVYLSVGLRTISILFAWMFLFSWHYSSSVSREPQFPNNSIHLFGYIESIDRHTTKTAISNFSVNSIRFDTVEYKGNFKVQFYSDSTVSGFLQEGRGYEIKAVVTQLPHPDNFSEFDYGKFLLDQNISGVIVQKNIREMKLNKKFDSQNGLFIGSIRHFIESSIVNFVPDLMGQAFARGLILGFRSWIPNELLGSFSLTGTMHVLSVSGLNVAFVTLIIFTPLIRIRSLFPVHGERLRVAITLIGILLYGTLTGWSISIVRAVIMASIFLLSFLLDRKRDVWSSISLAFILVLLFDPRQITQPGFLLSFAAVSGILHFNRMIKVKSRIGGDLLITVASLAATSPFTVYFFNLLPLTGIVANLVVVPGTTLILTFSILMIFSGLFSTYLASAFGSAVSFLTHLIVLCVDGISSLPLSGIQISENKLSIVFLLTGISLAIITLTFKRKIYLYSTLLITVFLFFLFWELESKQSIVSFLSCGQGDCTMLKTSSNELVVIDTGPINGNSRTNSSMIQERMKRWGFSEIDFLVVSHPHLDHFGGLLGMENKIQVKNIIIGDTTHSSGLFKNWLSKYETSGSNILQVNSKHDLKFDGFEKMEIFNIPLKTANANNSSLILKYYYGNNSIVLMGDSEKEQEHLIVQQIDGRWFSTNVFKVSHHGSRTSSSDELLQKAEADFAVVSVAKENKYRLPNKEILFKWVNDGSELFDTSLNGEIRFYLDGNNIEVENFKGRSLKN